MLLPLAMACSLHAGPAPFVQWIADSTSAFDVVLTGTGAGWSGTLMSPSGDWKLQSANIIAYTCANPSSPQVAVDNSGNATFEGALSPQLPAPNPSANAPFNAATIGTYGGYLDHFNPVAPISDKNGLVYGYLSDLSDFGPYLDWSGLSTISITSMPDPNDPSTWTWMAQYTACGQNLAAPEPNALSIIALAGVLVICKRCFKRNHLKAARS